MKSKEAKKIYVEEMKKNFTENESVTYAVRRAIEAAVLELVNKGEEENLWKFKEEKE